MDRYFSAIVPRVPFGALAAAFWEPLVHQGSWRLRALHVSCVAASLRILMWFICDALGITLGVLTWMLLAFADWVVIRYVIVGWFWTANPRFPQLPFTDVGVFLCLVYQCVIGLSWFSHLQAVTSDPGTIRAREAPDILNNPRVCKICDCCWKPARAHHCKTCKRCVFRMDHHCPWINNCVGLGNQKLFILFLSYTALAAVLTLIILSSSALYWLWGKSAWPEASPSVFAIVCSGLVAVECLAAVLFVSDFLQEQIESITTNCTLVETYQRTHGERTTFGNHFRIIFGRYWWSWPLPFPNPAAPDYLERAIPDEPGDSFCERDSDDADSLGIAGDESEAVAQSDVSKKTSQDEGVRSRLRPEQYKES